MIEALKRLRQAIQQLGAGRDGGSPAAGGDLMQQVGAMQTYWRVFLQAKQQDGAGYDEGADTSLTDVDQFMRPDAASVPAATLADLGGLLDDDALPPDWADDEQAGPPPGDAWDDVDAILASSDDDDPYADL